MNRGINIYTEEVYIENKEDLDFFMINERFNNKYFWKVSSYVNQKLRDIGTFIDRNDISDIELLEESRKQGLEYDNE